MKSPEQRGHYGALCLYQITVPCKIRMKSRYVIFVQHLSVPLTTVPNLRTALFHMDRFEDPAPFSNLEPVHMEKSGPCKLSQSAFKMHTQVAAGALIFIFRQSYNK